MPRPRPFHLSRIHLSRIHLALILAIIPVCTAAGRMARAAPPRRPNFVFFLTDDQRADAMSCAGNTTLLTPNMDRLAAEGMRFRNAFTTNSLCAPSRSSFLTGLYTHTTSVTDNKENLDRRVRKEIPLVSEHLRKAGYQVAFCGKSHMTGALRDRPWDYYFGFNGQGIYMNPRIAEGRDGVIGPDRQYEGWMDDIVTDRAIQWLEARDDRPFCLFLWFKAPHRSWLPAPRHRDLFRDVSFPRPDSWAEKEKGYPGKPRAFADADNKIGNAPDVTSMEFIRGYYGTLVGVDENVGKVLSVLERRRRLDDTMVVYSSDNGFFHGEWGLYDKRLMHEPSIRIPLLIRYPRMIRAGMTTDRMALNVDIAPTMLELAGIKRPKLMHGKSLVPLFADSRAPWRDDWLYEYYEFPGAHSVRMHRGVRTERYKLIHYFQGPEEWELYDLRKDPGERANLYGRKEYARIAARLERRILELRRETADPDLAPYER